MTKKIAVLVGSLRKESYNRKMAKVLISLAPKSLDMQIIEIRDLPLYNQDLDDENRPPKEWEEFRQAVKPYQGLLFVTPEYNRSVPGVLKNAIDVGSRPYGKSVWDGLPAAVISVSPGAVGGFGANQHIRQSFVFLNVPGMQQPEAYISHADKLFNEKGEITKEDTLKFLQDFIDSFAEWVELISK